MRPDSHPIPRNDSLPDAASAPPLPRTFCDRDVLELAPLLLGCVLVGRGVALRITEVEAYVGAQDPGSHAYRGRTARNATMFGEPGHLYVYRHMGLHSCMNVVADVEGIGTGCLIRAGEILDGTDLAYRRRLAGGTCHRDRDLARGPGRATVACGITYVEDGLDLCDPGSGMHLAGRLDPRDLAAGEAPGSAPLMPHPRLAAGPRIGLREEASHPQHYPWRYRIAGDPTVSGSGRQNA
ncbi:DNA-3-methyladenine glycosylase [Brachybacterium sacelli]|uniref:Putative 3-methyladenine DNA glycosylase n=1 Tax=Brachybacterium sacelli TaxID=173364 RepID=A0ABS4X5L1_9MICO|nr:DNA-3-methyladenine glycosylase [Brachybacterium sacelli]